ncbi:MAG TPA: hypothetical protein VFS20_23890 [Longimicrobium sp.]|nr:hypothetical protein [Longimicrobium sp.]
MIAAWRQWFASTRECKQFVNPVQVRITGKTEQGNTAEALVLITANWVGTQRDYFGNLYDPGFYGGPCAGFVAHKPNPQQSHQRMGFVKYDTGWQFRVPEF